MFWEISVEFTSKTEKLAGIDCFEFSLEDILSLERRVFRVVDVPFIDDFRHKSDEL